MQTSPHQQIVYTPINQLHNVSNWTIKARVIQKKPVKTYNSGNKEGQVFSIDLIDKSKSEIKATFFNQAVDKFKDVLKLGNIYTFRNGNIQKGKYNNQRETSIVFNEKAIIIEIQEQNNQEIPQNQFDFHQISKLHEMDDNSIVDVIGVVMNDSNIMEFKSGNGEIKYKRSFNIIDQSNTIIEVCLWGQEAQQNNYNKNSVFCIKHGRLGQYKQFKQITSLFSSQIYPDFDGQKAQEMKEWFEKNQQNVQKVLQESKSVQFQTKDTDLFQIEQIILQNIDKKGYQLWSQRTCTIAAVGHKEKPYYLSCVNENCSKRPIYDEQTRIYNCQSCQKQFQNPVAKYLASLKIQDSTGVLWCNIYDRVAKQIFPIQAEDARKLVEQGTPEDIQKLVEIMNRTVGKEYKMHILSKIEEYQGKTQIKHHIYKINEENASESNNQMINEIKQRVEEENDEDSDGFEINKILQEIKNKQQKKE